MPSDEDIALDEKRLYGEAREQTVVYVASGMGVTRVEVSGDRIGRFSLARRADARDVAGGEGRLLVATGEDVLLGTGDGFEPTGFGPARAVGLDRGRALAADPDGRVAVLSGDEWATAGRTGEPRTADGDLLAAADGVYRLDDGDLDRVRDGPARDVAAGDSLAACPDGLYDLPDTRLREGDHAAVASDGDRAHAVAGGDLFVRRGDWERCDLPTGEQVVDVAYGESVYAVTEAGTLLVRADPERTPDGRGGWRSRALGVRGARRLTVP